MKLGRRRNPIQYCAKPETGMILNLGRTHKTINSEPYCLIFSAINKVGFCTNILILLRFRTIMDYVLCLFVGIYIRRGLVILVRGTRKSAGQYYYNS